MYIVKLVTITAIMGTTLPFSDVNDTCQFCELAEKSDDFVFAQVIDREFSVIFEFLPE